MIKSAIRRTLAAMAYGKAAFLFGCHVGSGSTLALSADVRYSTLRGCNVIGRRSVVQKSMLGEFSYIGDDCRVVNIDIGKFTSIGSNLKTAFGRHPYHYLSQHPATYSLNSEMATLVTAQLYADEHTQLPNGRLADIGHDVWIGDDVKIFDGITVGHGAVIGANSLVTRSIPPYAIARGTPAEVVKYRFPEREVEILLGLKWWDWNLETLRCAIANDLLRGPVDALQAFYAARGASNE